MVKKLKGFLDRFLAGGRGVLVRTMSNVVISHYAAKAQGNEWFIAAGPLLALASKKLHDKWPAKFNWLPF